MKLHFKMSYPSSVHLNYFFLKVQRWKLNEWTSRFQNSKNIFISLLPREPYFVMRILNIFFVEIALCSKIYGNIFSDSHQGTGVQLYSEYIVSTKSVPNFGSRKCCWNLFNYPCKSHRDNVVTSCSRSRWDNIMHFCWT